MFENTVYSSCESILSFCVMLEEELAMWAVEQHLKAEIFWDDSPRGFLSAKLYKTLSLNDMTTEHID
jgi:hypothetical protein